MSNCTPIIYPNFTPAQIISGPPDIFVFRAHNNIFRSYSIQAGNDFNLVPQQTRNGGSYQLLVKKTIAGDVIINLPAGSIVLGDTTATSITLSGAQDEDFLIEFSFDGNSHLFWSVGSGGGGSIVEPGEPSSFSPNVIPFIDGNGDWQEDSNFFYDSLLGDLYVKNKVVEQEAPGVQTGFAKKSIPYVDNSGKWVESGVLQFDGATLRAQATIFGWTNKTLSINNSTGSPDYPQLIWSQGSIRFYPHTPSGKLTSSNGFRGSKGSEFFPGTDNFSAKFYDQNNNLGMELKKDGFTYLKEYTPVNAGDPNGEIGAMCKDDNNVYFKTAGGWFQIQLMAIT